MNKTAEISAESAKQLKINRSSYMFEAMFEYFISILVSGTFLTAILLSIGVSQSVAGVVTSLATFGYTAQFAAVLFLRPKGKIKRLVTVMHLVNQLMFAVLYLIPHVNIPHGVKVAAFAAMFLGGHIIHQAVQPFKLDWLMSYVPDGERGSFTANKEIMSLIGGMIFSFAMGCVIDYFKAVGKEDVGFIISGITIFLLCILHLVTVVIVKDPEERRYTAEKDERMSVKDVFKITVFDKKFSRIILLDVIWHIASGVANSYFSIYMQGSLGLAVTTLTVLTAVQSAARMLFSKFFGRAADKSGWANMLSVSFAISAVGMFAFGLASPENCFTVGGVKLNVFIIIYNIIYGIYMAGANSGMMNVTFDYVSRERRRYAIGAKSAIGGLAGFLASLAVSPFVAYMEENGCRIFGVNIYAQQVLAFAAGAVFLLCVLYIKKVVVKMEKNADVRNASESN